MYHCIVFRKNVLTLIGRLGHMLTATVIKVVLSSVMLCYVALRCALSCAALFSYILYSFATYVCIYIHMEAVSCIPIAFRSKNELLCARVYL